MLSALAAAITGNLENFMGVLSMGQRKKVANALAAVPGMEQNAPASWTQDPYEQDKQAGFYAQMAADRAPQPNVLAADPLAQLTPTQRLEYKAAKQVNPSLTVEQFLAGAR